MLYSWCVVWLMTATQVVIAITWPWDHERNAYEPYQVECPSFSLLREANSISDNEKEYVQARQKYTNDKLAGFLENIAQLSDFNASQFIDQYSNSHNITIGLAFSGGGYRAMLTGAGEVLAMDGRYTNANKKALGGLLDSSTYIAGLSGGSWLVGTLALNNWISVDDILSGKLDIWNLEDSVFNPNGLNIFKTGSYYSDIGTSLSAKEEHFETTLTDLWGRMLGYQFFTTDGGQNLTWSGIRNLSSFEDHTMPYPFVVADSRNPQVRTITLNSTVYEITPYEFGSWDPSVRSFVDTQYIGTNLDNGQPNSSSECVVNFDNGGFVLASSSTIFNQLLTKAKDQKLTKYLYGAIEKVMGLLSSTDIDVALYEPNPFYRSEYADNEVITGNSTMNLVDGGEDDQNIPLYPLVQPKRGVDVILAFDSSSDTPTGWPNGSALIHTYRRQFGHQGKGTPIPYMPSSYEEFLDQGLNERPVFFGCNASELDPLVELSGNKDINTTDVPLIVYVPNIHQSYDSNTSSFKLTYDEDEKLAMIKNGFEIASRGNFSDDGKWATCVGCAVIRRTQERFNLSQSSECQKCFEDYCWFPDKSDMVYSAVVDFSSSVSDSAESLQTSESLASSTRAGDASTTGEGGTTSSTGTSFKTPTSSASRSSDSGANIQVHFSPLMLFLVSLVYTAF
ncbi:lysophospholipase [Yamadazyma tenuis]|uniref:Lysophospholipase n=1 Tax=Candida tenuis (strain ATCC 10573 / BCRC 21748 / CBS 615 / JCM 9827 / NBRC 10315 / NRRL Y-1498 / VKM Y-70) TaxID=590646 RepID=G3AW83_CANTC|nr:uncharacterized protein CANTEDRAFT_117389 [Yamadazyma tenuis ATCC 10573]EGV66479.1 hypothetical protein CANTEDRAFT_117389 [Yamadazyma tenuis ATCC 10573]WEJ95406.1 lysophospholipase [Yamadazyma tenuis]